MCSMRYDGRVAWLCMVSLVCIAFAVSGYTAVFGGFVAPAFVSIVRLVFKIRRSHDEVKFTVSEEEEFDLDETPLETLSKKRVYLTALGNLLIVIGCAPLLFIRPYRKVELPSVAPLATAAFGPVLWMIAAKQ